MDSSTPDQNLNSGNPGGTSIPIANGLGGTPAPVASSMDSPTPSVPSSPLSPSSPMSPLEPPIVPSTPEPELTLKPEGGGFKKALPWIVAVVLAAVVGGGVYFWLGQEANSAKADLQAQKEKTEKAEKEASDLRAKLDETSESTTTTAPAASKTDQELIVAEMTADCNAYVNLKMFEVKEVKIEGNFATARNGCDLKTRSTTRFNLVTLKKVGELWVIVDAGSTPPTAAERAKFGIPASLYD